MNKDFKMEDLFEKYPTEIKETTPVKTKNH